MKKLLEKLKKDCKGAVTVMVTLLLIPAVLISGTGVDLARAYAAKSITQDANQMAANSALASYDALLQDLYGLFGMMTKDEEFAGMVNEYIETVLGENWKNAGMGSFQLLYSSDIQVGDVQAAPGMNLANTEVLRRQIEEYAKYRAPVIILEEMMAALDAFDKITADAKIVKQKMEIDEKVEEIDELYKEIYKKIKLVDEAGRCEDSAYKSINAFIDGGSGTKMDIKRAIAEMRAHREQYQEEADEEKRGDIARAYAGSRANVSALINGGTVNIGWYMGDYDEEGNYQQGGWGSSYSEKGLMASMKKSTDAMGIFIDELGNLVDLCTDADTKKKELEEMMDGLEKDLNAGNCSQQLRDGMTSKNTNTGKSMLDTYRELLKYDLSRMGEVMQLHDKQQIQENIDQINKEVNYGNSNLGGTFYSSFQNLPAKLKSSEIDYQLPQRLGGDEHVGDDLEMLSMVDPELYDTLGTFLQFRDFKDTHNDVFYKMLEELYGGTEGGKDNDKGAYEKSIKRLIGEIGGAFKKFLKFDPEGAHKFANAQASAAVKEEEKHKSYIEEDWGKNPSIIKEAMNDNIISRIGDGLESAANKVLLLTYDSEMFSCYATGKSGGSSSEENKEPEYTITGIPLGIEVNYYYQSELEFLFHGDRAEAIENLMATAGLLFLVRLVFNYVASFSIPSVQSTVAAVKSALAWAGPFAIAAGELARLALVLGESALDVGRLKGGSKVALYKIGDHVVDTDQGWRFSLGGLIYEGAAGIGKAKLNIKEESDDDSTGMAYKDYMRLFLLLVDGDVLAQRTANLIEMNVTNVKENIASKGDREAREAAMSEANMFLMRDAATGISLTTSLDLRMLFLSMPFAQKGVNGTVPPGKLEIAVTDYRGY